MNNFTKQNELAENPEIVKPLRLRQMLFLGRGTFVRQFLHAFISVALRLFFRRIEAGGVEKVPPAGAMIFVVNHPNGLIDPALVFVSLPRRISFLAKSTLFKIPVGGAILRALECLPIYRRIDAAGEMAKNRQTFAVCYELLGRGRCVAIFPEGISHDETKLQPMKTGAARIALGALGVGEPLDENLRIMAVGLYYTSKTAFRSEALIRYGEIIEVAPIKLEADGEPPREAVISLTARIEAALRAVTLNLENRREFDAVLKAEALFSSVYQNLLFKKTLTQSFNRLQNLAEKYKLLDRENPEKMSTLQVKIERYENELRTSGVTAESLSVLQHPTWYVFRYLILRLAVLLALAPLSIVGAIIHSPAFVFSGLVGQIFKTHDADDVGSTYKILAACVFMPLTWLVVALAILYFFGWQFALLSVPLTIICGYVALRSSETLVDLSVWLKSAWLLFRRRALFLRLLLERENIQREIGAMIEK